MNVLCLAFNGSREANTLSYSLQRSGCKVELVSIVDKKISVKDSADFSGNIICDASRFSYQLDLSVQWDVVHYYISATLGTDEWYRQYFLLRQAISLPGCKEIVTSRKAGNANFSMRFISSVNSLISNKKQNTQSYTLPFPLEKDFWRYLGPVKGKEPKIGIRKLSDNIQKTLFSDLDKQFPGRVFYVDDAYLTSANQSKLYELDFYIARSGASDEGVIVDELSAVFLALGKPVFFHVDDFEGGLNQSMLKYNSSNDIVSQIVVYENTPEKLKIDSLSAREYILKSNSNDVVLGQLIKIYKADSSNKKVNLTDLAKFYSNTPVSVSKQKIKKMVRVKRALKYLTVKK